MFKNFRGAFGELVGQKLTRPVGQPATIGDPMGRVEVPGRWGYVYAQTPGGILEVYNNRVTPLAGMQVLVGYDPLQPGLLQVLSTRTSQPVSGGGNGPLPGGGYAPASRYSWMHPDGGEDPVYIQLRQFMPLRIKPAGGLTITVYRGYMPSGQLVDTTTVDLTSHVPMTAGKVRFVLVYVDHSMSVQVVDGALVDLGSLARTDIPAPPAGAALCLAAVRLYYGQTAVVESRSQTDILDMRFPMWHQHGEGTENVLSSWTGETGQQKDSHIRDQVTGNYILNLIATLSGDLNITMPPGDADLAALNLAQTWTAAQEIRTTTLPQLVLAYDGTYKLSTSVESDGKVIHDLTGPGTVVFRRDSANRATLVLRSYGATGQPNAIVSQRARGSLSSPAPVNANDILFSFGGEGFASGDFAGTNQAVIQFLAAEPFSSTNQGSYIRFQTTPKGSTAAARATRGVIDDSGRWGIGTSDPIAKTDIVLPEELATDAGLYVHNTGDTELITAAANRDFSAGNNWSGTNWSTASGSLVHTPGSPAVASLANANLTAGSIIAGRYYIATFTITSITAGTVGIFLGTASSASFFTAGTYTAAILAVADDANFNISPSSTFNGTIDNVSLKRAPAELAFLVNGRMGIGTDTPDTDSWLHMVTYDPATAKIKLENKAQGSGAVAAIEAKMGASGQRVLLLQGSPEMLTSTTGAFHQRGGLVTDSTLGLGLFLAARQAAGDIRFYTGGVANTNERAVIDSAGRLGIGITTPTARHHVAGSADEVQQIVRGNATQTANLEEWQSGAGTVLGAIGPGGEWKPPSLADASASNNSIYYSTTANRLVYKDNAGTVNNLY